MDDLPLLLFSWVDVNDNLGTLENTADNLENLDGLPQLMDVNLENTADNLKPNKVDISQSYSEHLAACVGTFYII